MKLKDLTKKELLELTDELELEVKSKKAKPTNKEILTSIEAFANESEDNATELEEVYVELFDEDDEEKTTDPKSEENIFTYVGAGETSPVKINFMGKQTFIRGRATEVTDPIVLAKVVNNQCFVRGEVELEDLQDIEDEGIELAAKNRKADKAADDAFKKQHGGKE